MDLRTKINEKYKDALKLKNYDEVNALRLIRSAILDKDIQNRSSESKEPINEEKIVILLQSLVKQRKDSIEAFKSAKREDLINKEKKEIEIINQFLPKQLTEDEVNAIIKKFISENNISSIKEMGKIMGHLKSNYSGIIDMSIAGKLSKELLGE